MEIPETEPWFDLMGWWDHSMDLLDWVESSRVWCCEGILQLWWEDPHMESLFRQHILTNYWGKNKKSGVGFQFSKIVNFSFITWWTDLIRFYNLTFWLTKLLPINLLTSTIVLTNLTVLVGVARGELQTWSKCHSVVVSFYLSYPDFGNEIKTISTNRVSTGSNRVNLSIVAGSHQG